MAAEGRIVREGVVAGLIGAAAVAVLILIFDIASGAPLQSPAILGSAILKGIRDPNLVTVSAGPVLGYTILHGLGFIAVGLVAAFLVASAEREPEMVLALLIFFAAFEVFFLALIAFWALPVLGVLAWWEILAGKPGGLGRDALLLPPVPPGSRAEPDRPLGRRRPRGDHGRIPRRLGRRGLVPPLRRHPSPAAPHARAPRRRGPAGAPRSPSS